MTIENIAAEIVEKLHELVRDSKSNAQDTIAGIIKNGLSRFSERAPNQGRVKNEDGVTPHGNPYRTQN